MFSDIAIHEDKSAYLLGTIVFHHEGGTRNIVDGQQRTISLLLAVRALIQRNKEKKLERKDLRERLLELEQAMVNPSFNSEISQKNIHSNYLEVARIVSRADFTEAHIDFFLNKCQTEPWDADAIRVHSGQMSNVLLNSLASKHETE